MIIGVSGFGSTGSSAVSDYLLEFDALSVIDCLEFTWVSGLDGLVDLEFHIMHPHNRTSDSIAAIQRFKNRAKKLMRLYVVGGGIPKNDYFNTVNDFINSITNVKWMWTDPTKSGFISKYIDRSLLTSRLYPRIERIIGRQLKCYPYKEICLSVKPCNFYDAAKNHVRELLIGLGADFSKPIVLDQPFAGNNPAACFPFFEDPYAIVVDRDPRDNYVFARTRLIGRNHFMATETVEDFVKYYRVIRDNQPYKIPDDRILNLQFEDMVYDYDSTTEKIRRFLKLQDNPHPKSIFNPELSIANTQVYKRFPEYAEDVSYIERELPEYLFDYEKYGVKEITGEMFFGKSPLHK